MVDAAIIWYSQPTIIPVQPPFCFMLVFCKEIKSKDKLGKKCQDKMLKKGIKSKKRKKIVK